MAAARSPRSRAPCEEIRMRAGSGALAWPVVALLRRAAAADVFVVTTSLDNAGGLCPANPTTLETVVGTCSLRSAIAASNATANPNLILFAPVAFATNPSKIISIASPLPDLTASVEINATSQALITQRPQGIVVVATGGTPSLFAVLSGNTVLHDLALQNGSLSVQGSARLLFDQSVDATLTQAITGTGTLVKQGTAKLLLSGTNAY